jgi:CheY-like chemotaxis protein
MPTVLYAEDDVKHLELMRVILKDTDITLVEATDGQEALQKIQHQHPDLILLDLFMPKLDGHGVMEALKSDPKTKHIPIIVLSAWSTGDNRKRARIAGAKDFIAKPYDPAEVVQVVTSHLGNNKISTNPLALS